MRNKLIILFLICIAGIHSVQAQIVQGRASYYSDKLQGNFMSNGERYHRDSMTCAHLKYPFGTMLRVRNLSNGREVVVRVTDRGPHTRRFILDLSRAAAKELDIIRAGHAWVEITPYEEVRIPFRWTALPESELDWGTTADSGYVLPYWQTDTILEKKKNEPHKIRHLEKKVRKILREVNRRNGTPQPQQPQNKSK